MQGLVVWYKEQERTATPVPYPWTFFLGDPKNNTMLNETAGLVPGANGAVAIRAATVRAAVATADSFAARAGLRRDRIRSIPALVGVPRL